MAKHTRFYILKNFKKFQGAFEFFRQINTVKSCAFENTIASAPTSNSFFLLRIILIFDKLKCNKKKHKVGEGSILKYPIVEGGLHSFLLDELLVGRNFSNTKEN